MSDGPMTRTSTFLSWRFCEFISATKECFTLTLNWRLIIITSPIVQQIKYQRIIFNNKINFKARNKYFGKKCTWSLDLLKSLGRIWAVSLRLYRSVMGLKLVYSCTVYSSAHRSYHSRLQLIQNQGFRICLGAFATYF